MDMIGQKLRARYRLDQRLGGGNQGEVYLAYDENIRRQVAIKILKTATADSTETQLLVHREAIATAQFEHPNVVRVFDFNNEDVPFLVKEYLRGENADQLQLPLDATLLKLLVSQICGALQNAHDQGLVHRDLKPGNLMLVDRGKPEQRFMILDLGLAKLTEHGKLPFQATYSGAGTPLYMSPEQINGESVDFRSDIYSFGTMLFEMLTGVGPFATHGRSLGSLLRAVCNDPPPRLLEAFPNGQFSQELEELIADCLEKDRDRRPSSMREIEDRFHAAFRISTQPPQPVAPSGSRRGLWVSGAIASLLGAGFLLNWQFNTPAVPTPILPPTVTQLEPLQIPNQTIDEGKRLAIELGAGKAGAANTKLQYRLVSGPSSARLSRDGRFEWTPTEKDGPGTFPVVVVAQSSNTPPQRVESKFDIKVQEVNQPPSLEVIPDQTAESNQQLKLIARASDPDLPANRLTFRLDGEIPPGAKIDPQTGEFTWTPTSDQAGSKVPIRVQVTDGGTEALHADAAFQVAVAEIDRNPKEFTNSIGMKLVRIEPGEFLMGAATDEELHEQRVPAQDRIQVETKRFYERERPQHRVRFEKPFYMGTLEVTQGEFARVMRDSANTSPETDTQRLPMVQVTWQEANDFCLKLSELAAEQAEGRRYRLPTEAEWEYACRAGTNTPYQCEIEQLLTYAHFKSEQPKPVGGRRKPNAWGLYDMHGNVWEWCSDYFDPGYYPQLEGISVGPTGPSQGSEKVIRGGGYPDVPFFLRSAFRGKNDPALKESEIGFRVICEPRS